MAANLVERVSRGFSKVKLKKASVKVPWLKVKKREIAKSKKEGDVATSSIINILIKTAVEKAKREKKEKRSVDEDKSYAILKEDKALTLNGGYGTVSKGYGTVPHTSYVDYGKLFSYLGKFKAQSAYGNLDNPVEFLNKSVESGSFVLADKDSMDKIGRFDKYMRAQDMAIQTMALSLVPIAGLSSAEWEEIKNLMRFDQVMYTLKSKIS